MRPACTDQTKRGKKQQPPLFYSFFSLDPCIFLYYMNRFRSQVVQAFEESFLCRGGGLRLGTIIFEEVSTVAEGTVKWFSEQKGYGFIEQDEGGDIFVHHSEINMVGFRTLAEGDRVTFEVGEGTKGPAAKNVSKL